MIIPTRSHLRASYKAVLSRPSAFSTHAYSTLLRIDDTRMAFNQIQCKTIRDGIRRSGLHLPTAAIADAFSNSCVWTICFYFKLVSGNFNLNMDVCLVGLTKKHDNILTRPSIARREELIGLLSTVIVRERRSWLSTIPKATHRRSAGRIRTWPSNCGDSRRFQQQLRVDNLLLLKTSQWKL